MTIIDTQKLHSVKLSELKMGDPCKFSDSSEYKYGIVASDIDEHNCITIVDIESGCIHHIHQATRVYTLPDAVFYPHGTN